MFRGELWWVTSMWNSHDVNYVNKCKSDVAAKLTGRLDWNFAWAFLMVSICYLQMMEPIGRELGKFWCNGLFNGDQKLWMAITFELIKISIWGFSGLLLWRSRLLNKGEIKHPHVHHIHTYFDGLLLNGAKTIGNMQTYPFPQYP